jgi:hypothetical protein
MDKPSSLLQKFVNTDGKSFITLGPGLIGKKLDWAGKTDRDKHSTLLWKSVNYGRKKFYNIGPRTFVKKLIGVKCIIK